MFSPPPAAGDPIDAGAVEAGPFETLTPTQWGRECETRQRRDHCAALAESPMGPLAELAALAMNMERAAELGHPFADLHFSHGRRASRSVGALLELAQSPDAEPWTRAAVYDANRAFEHGTDLHVLTAWSETPLCGVAQGPGTWGPQGAPCAALDSACARGRHQPEGCCDLQPDPRGAPCAEGVCDGTGACVPRDSDAEPPSDDAFLEIWPEAADAVLWHGDPMDRVRDGAIDLVEIPSLSDDAERGRISIVHAGAEAHLAAIAVSAPPGERGLFLHPREELAEVCVMRGDVDELGTVRADCSSPGTVVVACPGEADGVRCERVQDGVVVRGVDVALAWARADAPFDLLGALGTIVPTGGPLPLCIGRFCVILFPLCRPRCAGAEPCFRTDGAGGICRGFRSCSALTGCLGACTARPPAGESCNGRDDDCDGRVDERGAVLCDDRVACTDDECVDGMCVNRPNTFRCLEAACAEPICMGVRDRPGGRPGERITPRDANGCQQAQSNEWCEDLDRCVCNGQEICEAALPGPRFTGCRTPLQYDYLPSSQDGDGIGPEYPCFIDRNNCTAELLCCEPNDDCIALQHLTDEQREAAQALCEVLPGVQSPIRQGIHCPFVTESTCPPPTVWNGITCAVDCEDGNACSANVCDSRRAECYPPFTLPDGRRRGCGLDERGGQVTINQGCAQQRCASGACVTEETVERREIECSGDLLAPHFDTCAERVCVGTECRATAVVPRPGEMALCDDGLSCTQDLCVIEGFPPAGSTHDPNTPFLCWSIVAPGVRQCAIPGVGCVPAGTEQDPDAQCSPVCDPAQSTRAWSAPPARPCDDGNPCSGSDRCVAPFLCTGDPICEPA